MLSSQSQEEIWNLEYKNSPNKWRKETLKFPQLLKNSTVLELGAGNGKTANTILKQDIKSLVCTDFSNQSISLLKSNIKDKRAIFIKANLTKLPFKDKSFDVVICYYVLNNLLEKDRIKAVKEINRVMKENAVLYFKDFAIRDFRNKNSSKKTIEKNTIKNGKGLLCHFFQISELKDLFKSFSKVSFKENITSPLRNKPEVKRRIISGKVIR
jgi:ubiquinone/menaquinone biosynthesis C-methylase UbiE